MTKHYATDQNLTGDDQFVFTAESLKSQVLSDVHCALKQFPDGDRAAAKRHYQRVSESAMPRMPVDGTLIDQFCDKHTAVHGTIDIVATRRAAPKAVNDFLEQHELPTQLVMGNTELLNCIDWPNEWQIERRSACKTDRVSVTDAICAIAETGTLVMVSSPQVSSTHLYVPENHIVILDAGQLVRHLEDAFRLLGKHRSGKARGIHLVTGPSKTADVEQTIQYGAHGPRRVHIVLIDTRKI